MGCLVLFGHSEVEVVLCIKNININSIITMVLDYIKYKFLNIIRCQEIKILFGKHFA